MVIGNLQRIAVSPDDSQVLRNALPLIEALLRLLAKQVLQQPVSGADVLQHTRAAGLSVALGHLACDSCTVMSAVALLYQEARAWFFMTIVITPSGKW